MPPATTTAAAPSAGMPTPEQMAYTLCTHAAPQRANVVFWYFLGPEYRKVVADLGSVCAYVPASEYGEFQPDGEAAAGDVEAAAGDVEAAANDYASPFFLTKQSRWGRRQR